MRAPGALLALAFSPGVFAQVPPAPASPAAPTTTIEQDKGGATSQQRAPQSSSTRPGNTPLPMNIKIQGEGIKMPACTAESREGEACKK